MVLILIANFLISLIAFVGVFTLRIKKKLFDKIIFVLVALSAGVLMGGGFFTPHSRSDGRIRKPRDFSLFLVGFILSFLIEKLLRWRHCHKDKCKIHTFTYVNLLGEAVHNFIDGLVIAASFVANPQLGWTTTLAVALHEIPQEISDFGVLVYGGFKKQSFAFKFSCRLNSTFGRNLRVLANSMY